MGRWYLRILLTGLFFSTGFSLKAQHFVPEQETGLLGHVVEHGITTEEGLPANGINDLIQDSKKYIWAATYNGLVRYDGRNIRIYNSSEIDDLGSNRFLTIFEDSKGCIWAGLEYSYILTICGESTEVIHLDEEVGGFNNHVTHLNEGPDGTLWIGTNNGLLLLREGKFITPEKSPSNNVQKIIHEDDRTYVLFHNSLLRFQDETFDLEIARLNSDGDIITSEHQINDFQDPEIIFTDFEIDGSNLLLLTHAGLVQLDENGYKILIHRDQIGQELIVGMQKRGEINYLYGSDGVVAILNIEDDENLQMEKYSSHFITYLLIDHEGSLWQSTRSKGLQQLLYTPIVQKGFFSVLDEISVTAPLFDQNDNFWIGTNCDGLYRFSGNEIEKFGVNEGFGNTCVWSLMEQQDGTLWAGTWGGGVYFKTKESSVFRRFAPEGFENVNEVLSIYEDKSGSIWFGSYYDGLFRYKNGAMESVIDDKGEKIPGVRMFHEDASGRFWLATDSGMKIYKDGNVVSPVSNDTMDVINFRTITDGPENSVWFGSYGRGLFLLTQNGGYRQINVANGLYDETISQMKFDQQENLWLAGNDGVFFIDHEQIQQFLNREREVFRVSRFGVNEGMTIRETTGGFMPSSAFDDDGFLYIPTVQGLVQIDTPKMELNRSLPEVFIQSVQIDGEPIQTDLLDEISYRNQRIVFHFAALSFLNPDHVQIEYKLEGLDEEWRQSGNSREAVYTTLPPGEYELRVKATNNDGFWSEEDARLAFAITPPFWQQTWFIITGIIIFLGAVAGAFQYRMWRITQRETQLQNVVREQTSTIRQEKEELEKAYSDLEAQKKIIEENNVLIERQTQKLKRQDELKSRFFANISHELRTPLTLIKGTVEQALKGRYGDYGDKLERELRSLMTHTDRLQTQVEYLLELSDLEIGETTVTKKIYDLNSQVSLLCDYFNTWADQEEVVFNSEITHKPLQVYADPGKMEKVLLSLFSNAIAYTHKGNRIQIQTDLKHVNEEKYSQIVLKHDGKEFSEEEKALIFDKFHQHTSIGGIQSHTGLALAKEWLELHDGKIKVDAEPGKETCFEVLLPLLDLNSWMSRQNSGQEQEKYQLVSTLPEVGDSNEELSEKKTGDPSQKTVVLVEDDMIVRLYIEEVLNDTYNIISAENGEKGLELIKEVTPDLVISDVMMPEMTGYELCKRIRENSKTRSIPVVLLTAKANDESKIEGLQHGADAYLTKPFKEIVLKETLRNLIDSRDRLLQHYKENQHLDHLLSGHPQESLLSRLDRLINENMEDPDLTIEDLARQLHVSQRQLQRKIKNQTGLTPKKYLRLRRLEAARHLLENDYGTITQVAYATGFNTLSLFSSYFKKEFGRLPSDVNNPKK